MIEHGPELTIAQTSEATGVSAHTLRYYERAQLIGPIRRNGANQRRFAPEDVAWIRFVLRLRATGMPIAQMRVYARLRERGPITTAERLALLERHHTDLSEQLAQLHAHETALAEKIALYRTALTTTPPHRPKDSDDD